MPITGDFNGQTFVAFTDISGFRSMMGNETRLMKAMDALYSSGYRNLGDLAQPRAVEGIFISDCGILFARIHDGDKLSALNSLLQVLAAIHRDVFESAFSLATSVAFGPFTYRGKVEFEGLEKSAIHGHAYVSAFKDNESDVRKLYPNECRLLKAGFPPEISLENINSLDIARGRIRDEDKHYYFEWMKKQ